MATIYSLSLSKKVSIRETLTGTSTELPALSSKGRSINPRGQAKAKSPSERATGAYRRTEGEVSMPLLASETGATASSVSLGRGFSF